MKITNKYNLPDAIYQATSKMSRLTPPQPHKISVTQLISPPLIRHLQIRHWDELEEDCSDRLWSLLGQAVHSVLEHTDMPDASKEQYLKIEYKGWTITGRPDLLHDGILSDYKVTSVYSFLLGDKPEWTAQLNVYQWMLIKLDYPLSEIYNHAILRDWQKSKTLSDPDYPKIPFLSNKLDIWDLNKITAYIDRCLQDHTTAELGLPRPCTSEERWRKPTIYAVMKEGRKSALRIFDSLKSAEVYVSEINDAKKYNISDIYLIERPGEDVRCKSYCQVRDFCPVNIYNQNEAKGINIYGSLDAATKSLDERIY